MAEIRPISDLKNKLSEIERTVQKGNPVFLTKKGYGSMVVMSMDSYTRQFDEAEMKLDEADAFAVAHSERLTHSQIFNPLKRKFHDRKVHA